LDIDKINKLKQEIHDIECNASNIESTYKYEKTKPILDSIKKEYKILLDRFYDSFNLNTEEKKIIALCIIRHDEGYVESQTLKACEDLLNYMDACLNSNQRAEQWDALHLLKNMQ
jgi:hypothetical protein